MSGGEEPVERPLRVAVVGAGVATPRQERDAEALGRMLARAGAVVVCGGLGGVMTAAARGAAEEGGLTVGILPGREPDGANPWIGLPLASGMGEGRNVLVVRAAEAVVAVGGEWGTLSEIALARKIGRSVVLLGPAAVEGMALPSTGDPRVAADMALDAARRSRGAREPTRDPATEAEGPRGASGVG